MPVEDRVVVHGGGVVDLFEEPLDVDRALGGLLPRVDGGHTSLCNNSPPSRFVRGDILDCLELLWSGGRLHSFLILIHT